MEQKNRFFFFFSNSLTVKFIIFLYFTFYVYRLNLVVFGFCLVFGNNFSFHYGWEFRFIDGNQNDQVAETLFVIIIFFFSYFQFEFKSMNEDVERLQFHFILIDQASKHTSCTYLHPTFIHFIHFILIQCSWRKAKIYSDCWIRIGWKWCCTTHTHTHSAQ